MNIASKQFENQAFLNLETFRKDGTGVKTPVWFVEQEGKFYIRTLGNSWKVKRISNNPKINITPCKSRGEPVGTWVTAKANLVKDPDLVRGIKQLFEVKYGDQMRQFDSISMKEEMTTLEIILED